MWMKCIDCPLNKGGWTINGLPCEQTACTKIECVEVTNKTAIEEESK